MALSDPFSTTFQGAYDAGSSLGQGIQSAAGSYAKAQQDKNKRKQAFDILKQFGMVNTKTEEPSLEELEKGAKDFAKENGSELSINYGNNPETAKKNLMGIYKALGIPLPKGKTTTELNLSPGTKYDPVAGDVEFSSPKSVVSPFGLTDVAPGMEIVGYDQKHNPMIRKIKRDIAGEKLDIKKEEDKKVQEAKSQMVLDNAKDTLNTISEVEKGIDNFGMLGSVPSIPGTARKTWETNVNKLLAGKVIDTIKSMKEASRTGATGFGNLNMKELETLQNASSALRKDLPKEDAQKYINAMKMAVQKIIDNKSGGTSEVSNMSDDELRAIINGE